MNEIQNRPWDKYYRDVNEAIVFPEVSLYSFLADSENKYGDQPAITFNDQVITYSELKNKTDRLANSWRDRGFEKGERIGLMLGNHPDYIVSYYAAMSLGLIIVQINPSYTPREFLQILDDAKVSYIVADNRSLQTIYEIEEFYPFKYVMTSQVKKQKTDYFLTLDELIEQGSPLYCPVEIKAKDDIAVIQYTGGTTGKIKGAMLTHHNLTTNAYQSFTMYRQKYIPGKETVLTVTPLYHVYAMTSAMNVGIFLGANLLLLDKFDIDKMMKAIKKYRPTVFPGVPKMYISIANYPNAEQFGLNSLKICSSGSAPLPVEVIRRFEEVSGATILEGFGMSETSPTTHRTPINGKRKVGSIGIPVPETDCCITDNEHNLLEPNYVGELLIRGPQVMKGYWNNESETKHALVNGWLRTGDLATMDHDGYFYIVGRKKEMIIFGGFNIYPQEIESVLYDHEDVKEAAVVGIPDEIHDEIVKAYVVPKEGRTIDTDALKSHCYSNLTPYKVPKSIEVRESLPRNGVGKLLKRLLVKEEMEKGVRVNE
ncbi:long-chain fatty acid--CoA ligase [Fictibacillus sp. 7GRE50]|uniref:long-chain-fatty-acid--CoA ligase n=1 Tax=Fictibacillus sp. 7GRE50 TaxID=2745878 RepID=UPI0018CF5DF6|nr:long-chain fatty acid--CoA ligase [Fictibacillus sp. 7GRE50]MBH0166065.1 long-chain fatty acid--CoA ligase [Fictibacillus sp. 7GRE50]